MAAPERDSPPDSSAADSKTERLVWVAIAVILFVVACNAVLAWFFLADWEERGDFGSMFGAANALFSGLALAGIIYTLFLQRMELGLQRQELQLTREELTRAANAQEGTERALTSQLRFLRLTARVEALAALVTAEATSQHGRDPTVSRMLERLGGGTRPFREQLRELLDELDKEG